MGENTALSGMVAIRDFCRSINLASSEASVIQFIKEEEFPARKLGGVWESDKEEILIWRRNRLRGNIDQKGSNVLAKNHANNKVNKKNKQ